MKKNRITHGSVFSGIGGAELAASWMGWDNLFHCEIDAFCRRVLGYWFPKSECYEDVKTTDFTKWRGRIDVLTGGFPCQGFSVAGRRKGTEDDRYLWPEMLRVIREVRPAWYVGENVAGLLSMVQPGTEAPVEAEGTLFGADNAATELRQRYVIDQILSDIEEAGYSVTTFVLPACAVGAPHRRDRVWLVARRNGGVQPPADDADHDAAAGGPGYVPAEEQGQELRQRDQVQHPAEPGGLFGPAAHADMQRRDTDQVYGGAADETPQEGRAELQPRRIHRPHDRWRDFPAQPPVCPGYVWLSDLVDPDAIRPATWALNTVKAAGNSWVPELSYEIFRCIDEIYNSYSEQ